MRAGAASTTALYGTDAMGSLPPPGGYERGRGARVIARARVFLDEAFPIAGHEPRRRAALSRAGRRAAGGRPAADGAREVRGLPRASAGAGRGAAAQQRAACGAGLRPDASQIGARDQAGLADVRLEAALSAIMDCEDSVACVDAEDKVAGLPQLARADEGRPCRRPSRRAAGRSTRRLAPDRDYLDPTGATSS